MPILSTLEPRRLVRTSLVWKFLVWASLVLPILYLAMGQVHATGEETTKFRRVPTQFIAALGDPVASSGSGAQSWGMWQLDPGPRGVWIKNYQQLKASGGVAPANWEYDDADWWLEENGLIMEKPEFPVAPGKYVVTGDREAVTILTVHPPDEDGDQQWELADDVSLYDVTHLPCRSARYTPISSDISCTPVLAQTSWFPVTPGATMPPVEGCNKQDYAVLFVIGVAVEDLAQN